MEIPIHLNALLVFLLLPIFVLGQQTSTNTYDYIVVGSGPGGGPLAANLAKNGSSVLLLEAGGDQGGNLKEIVASWGGQAKNDPLMRWDFFVKYHSDDELTAKYDRLTWRTKEGLFYVGTSPPAGATQLGVYYPRAGTLGGCSTHNALVSALPSDSDWQFIADVTGDESWEAANVRKYFMRIEHNDYLPRGTPGHGFDGYLNLRPTSPEQLNSNNRSLAMLQVIAKELGQDPAKVRELVASDLNNNSPDRDQQTGIFGFITHRDLMGRRVSARNPVDSVANATKSDGSKLYKLAVSTNSFVTRILFDVNTDPLTGKAPTLKPKVNKPRALGVEYLVGESMYSADPRYKSNSTGVRTQAYARKEVIISGGTFNTPQILKVSGIGPAAELSKFKIPVIVDLPGVGTNLQDNYETAITATGAQNFTDSTGIVCTNGKGSDPCLDLWRNGTGPYTWGLLDAIMYKTSNAAYDERDLFMWGTTTPFKGFWPSETVNVVPSDPPNTYDFSMAKMHSRSRLGTVLLRSSNPRDMPEINFRFFEDEDGEDDLAAMAEGLQFARKVFNSVPPPLGPFKETMPCKSGKCDDRTYIETQAWSHHATSSCSIGADNDKMAVLDSKFRVRGTIGLRVVDASVFPRSPGGFPVLPTFIVSEKAFEVIVSDS